jgi:hypothetical protein
MMSADIDTPDLTDAPDPSAGWSDRRRRYEAERDAENRRGAELLAMTRNYDRDPGVVVVQGRWEGFLRNRGTAALRARKREAWAERWRR